MCVCVCVNVQIFKEVIKRMILFIVEIFISVR